MNTGKNNMMRDRELDGWNIQQSKSSEVPQMAEDTTCGTSWVGICLPVVIRYLAYMWVVISRDFTLRNAAES